MLRPDGSGRIQLIGGRDNYTAIVLAAGIAPLVPIALSRNQTADLPVITPVDLAVIGLAVLFTVAGVFALGRGRPRVRRFIRYALFSMPWQKPVRLTQRNL